MKKVKRWTALLLACVMVLTMGQMQIAAAEEETQKPVPVSYLVVEEPVLSTPGTQRVMLGIGDGDTVVESAVLSYRSQSTGEVYETEAAELSGGFALFEMEFQDESLDGVYQLDGVSYTADGRTASVSCEQMGIDAAFGVNREADSTPDDVLLTDEELEALTAGTQMEVVALDDGGNPVSGETLADALEEAGCQTADMAEVADMRKSAGEGVEATGMKSLVVVLDAGHGGSDPGAMANGIVEKTVNLKIAQYCKAELEEYSGVIVYMTRNDDTYLSLAARAQVAIDKRADVFVSLHNNSNTSSVPYGANVYYPNANYNAGCGATGQALANTILAKLTELGLANGGIHIRNSENGTKYPDGSAADYYGVIKRCKENGIPALIVEHAFLSNASDAKNYLSTDAQLKKLGVADATGIAEYFGLKKGLGFNSIQSKSGTTMDLTWTPVVGVTGYCIYRSLTSGDGFEEVARITSAATTSWRDTGLTSGTTYYYKIRTYTKSGSDIKYSKYSAVASGTTVVSPEISSVKSKNSRQLEISWSTINGVSNYELYRAGKKNGTYKKIATLTGINRVNYIDKKVTAGKKYFYKIRSISQVDGTTVYSEYSAPVSGRTAKIPTDIAVKSQATDTLRISWTGDANAAGYIIKRATSANGKYKKVGTAEGGAVSHYDDVGVKANTYYYYKVQAYNYNNGIKGVSGFGKTASAKTIKKTAINKLTTNSATSQTISWKKVSGIDGYLIYQSTSKNGKYQKLKKVSASKTSCKVTNLTPGVRYYYKIRTRKKLNGKVHYGSYSTVRNAWTPKAPELTAVLGNTAGSVRLYWNPIDGAISYDIYRADTENGSYQKIASVSGTDVSYIDPNLNMNNSYFYKIEATVKNYKTTLQSGMSGAVEGRPVSTANITSVAANAQNLLEITWNAVGDVQGYQIYRSTEADGTYSLIGSVTDPNAVSYVDRTAVRGVVYYYKMILIGQYGGGPVYGAYSPAASGSLPAAQQ